MCDGNFVNKQGKCYIHYIILALPKSLFTEISHKTSAILDGKFAPQPTDFIHIIFPETSLKSEQSQSTAVIPDIFEGNRTLFANIESGTQYSAKRNSKDR
jgi:hypothetical protein